MDGVRLRVSPRLGRWHGSWLRNGTWIGNQRVRGASPGRMMTRERQKGGGLFRTENPWKQVAAAPAIGTQACLQ